MLRSVAFVAAATAASCNMIDVIEKLKLTPPTCLNGCDDWSNHDASLWKDGKVPADAGSYCAQPGAVVNKHTYGAWCYCKQGSSASAAAPAPPSWDDLGAGRCSAKWGKQFGATPPKGFAYDTTAAFKDAMYYTEKVTLDQCQDLCAYNLTNCDYISYVSTQQLCYVAEWCDKQASAGSVTYHNGAQPVPPAPTSTGWAYCVSPKGVPEQINLQVASSSSVVISFVTFEETAPTSPPVAVVNGTSYTGVTHVHKSPSGDRTYYMHFVLVKGLKAKTQYSYTVQSGGKHTVVSDAFTFRAPYQGGETKINIYGDMGIYEWNNMEWLEKDCAEGTSDLIVHMGDHAYNEGEDDGRRADGYMGGFQPVLSKCPWLPNVGNHEFYSGEKLSRYLDSTWQKWGPLPMTSANATQTKDLVGRSTATSALGYLLSAGNHHGAGLHGSTPSQTSRYFSVDVGQAHLIALDFNGFFGTDACGQPCIDAQMEWLKKDLAAANKNREQVPWIIAFSHFPLFCTGCQGKGDDLERAFYESSDAEKYGNRNRTAAKAWGKTPAAQKMLKELGYKTMKFEGGGASTAAINYLEPVLMEYGVDMYVAGHWHYYESLWPLKTGNASCPACGVPTQKSFNAPRVTVHVTSGNGGPPGIDTFTEDCPGPDCHRIPATRKQTTEFGYGRLTIHNETHITFQQRLNKDGSIFDEWTVYQPKHGPFTN